MDAIRAYLVEREVGPHVIDGGLDYLVRNWARVASDVHRGSTWMIEEWENDLDARKIIHELLRDVPEAAVIRPEVELADSRFRAGVRATEECVWGQINADRHGWTRNVNWWYWTAPPTPYE